MMGSQKSKRVSWASDVNLCQVRLFLSEDSPSQVSSGSQDHLQAKASWLLHTTGTGPDDHPPGFEGAAHTENQLKKELAQLSLPKWQCPPRIVLNPYWQVVAGEESKEAGIQKERELKVLEAVYPRPSAIPPSPSVSLESGDSHCEDHRIPLIPVTPIEDEEASDHSFSLVASSNMPMISQPPLLPQSLSGLGVLQTFQGNTSFSRNPHVNEKPAVGVIPGAEPDVVAAASAAFTAIMRSNEQGSLIDPELLIKILKNPDLMEKLVYDYGTPDNRQTAPNPMSMPMPMNFSSPIPSNPQTAPKPRSPPMNFSATQSGSFPVQNNRIDLDTRPPLPTAGHFYSMPNAVTATLQTRPPPGIPPPPPPMKAAPSMKDMSYYKNLIQQHGGERSEAEDQTIQQLGSHHQQYNHQHLPEQPLQSSKTRDTKPKINKPCLYYNSSRGCKYGANCQFLHDTSYQQRMGSSSSSSSSSSMQEAQSAKRMKLDREITGRT